MMDLVIPLALALATLIALINAFGMMRIIQKGLKLDANGFKQFDKAMLFLAAGLFIISAAHIAFALERLAIVENMGGVYIDLVGALTFVLAVAFMSRIPSLKAGGLLKVDWGELSKEIEATDIKIDRKAMPLGLIEKLGMKSVVLVEVDDVGVQSVFKRLAAEFFDDNKTVIPLIGVITPFDLERMWKKLGTKAGFWVTSSDITETWVNEKFVVAKPSELFQLTNYVKSVAKRYGRGVCFIGDFLDELHTALTPAQLQQLISKLRVTIQQGRDVIVIIIDKGVHSHDELEILERYADAKIEIKGGERTTAVFRDMQENTTEELQW